MEYAARPIPSQRYSWNWEPMTGDIKRLPHLGFSLVKYDFGFFILFLANLILIFMFFKF